MWRPGRNSRKLSHYCPNFFHVELVPKAGGPQKYLRLLGISTNQSADTVSELVLRSRAAVEG